MPVVVHKTCASCRLPSETCAKVRSTNGKQMLWKCQLCRERNRARAFDTTRQRREQREQRERLERNHASYR